MPFKTSITPGLRPASTSPARRRAGPFARVPAGHCALALCGALAAGSLHAKVVYGAGASIELQVTGTTPQVLRLSDPDPAPRRTDTVHAHAGREAFITSTDGFWRPVVASARASATANGNGVSVAGRSVYDQSPDDWRVFAWSSARSEASLEFSSTMGGAPGTTGTVVLSGVIHGVASPGLFPRGRASLNAMVFAQTYHADTTGCRRAECLASDSAQLLLQDGESMLRPMSKAWRLELPAAAGHMLTFSAVAAMDVWAGYSGNVGVGGVPDGAGAAGDRAASWAEAAAAVAPMSVSLLRIELSPGLEFTDTAGLARQSDGSWALATPVPEPGSLWLWAAGGGFVAWRCRARRPATRPALPAVT